MTDSIRLCDAIKANKNGIDRLIAEQSVCYQEAQKWKEKAYTFQREISARFDMLRAMESLQAVYPADETIKFVVP